MIHRSPMRLCAAVMLTLALGSCCGTCAAQPARIISERTFGWRGDDGSKPARLLAPQQWPIRTAAAASDLSTLSIPALDQGSIGSCVGHGCALAWTVAHYKATGEHLPLSRLMIYFNARDVEGLANADTGCQIVDAVQQLIKLGSCSEALWPYDVRRFREKPCACKYREALNHRIIRAFKIDNTDARSIRLALTNGFPVVFGALVYSGIYDVSESSPVIPLPRKGERPQGGHCMVIIGHDDMRQIYRIQNSWGPEWGQRGCAWIPYAYIHNGRLTEDCWVIDEVMPAP